MIIDVTEKEAYLIHRMRSDVSNATIVYSLMECPYEKDELERKIEKGITVLREEADRKKQTVIYLSNTAKKQTVKQKKILMIALTEIEDEYNAKAKEKEDYYRNLQNEYEQNMKMWLSSKKQTRSMVSIVRGESDNGND